MPEDYQNIVLAAYKKMKDNGKLSAILTGETTTRLREACLRVYDDRYTPKDADILSMFFKKDRLECDDFRKMIYDSVPDDYKALYNHIKGETGKTKEENTDLLAWLIDFPTNYEWRELSDQEKKRVFEDATRKKKITKKTGGDKTTGPKTSRSETRLIPHTYIVISCILLLSIGSISFIVWEQRMPAKVRIPNAGENSMYWDGDHYEPVKAGEQESGVTIIPLDLKKLQQQRIITLPDTLTKYSLGKVWYKGYGKGHEYFTDSGIYPPDTNRRLKPLSSEILKYSSYDRYLLYRLVWFICAALCISLCGYGVSRIKKKVTVDNQVQKTDDQIADFSEAQLAQQ